MQILCTLRNVKSILGLFSSDILAQYFARSGTVIINAFPHTEKFQHCLAILFEPEASSAYYFDSYRISPLILTIHEFLKRNCTVWV